MPRVYIPLLPLPILAAVFAFSACGSRSGEPASHVIPAPLPLAAAAVPPAPPLPAPAAPTGDDTPSEEEVRAFQRPVAK